MACRDEDHVQVFESAYGNVTVANANFDTACWRYNSLVYLSVVIGVYLALILCVLLNNIRYLNSFSNANQLDLLF